MKRKQMKKWILLNIGMVLMLSMAGCGKKQDEVVVYTAVDQVYADEIFEMFEEETGITVKAVYDTESNKTTGLTTGSLRKLRNRCVTYSGTMSLFKRLIWRKKE